jgi:hypothetical protein
MAAIVDERERLAHEMRDTLVQSFAGIGFHLQGLYNGIRSGKTKQAEAVTMLHGACEMVAHSHREASACIAALHQDADEGQDFLEALNRSTREMLSSSDGALLPLEFIREGTPQPTIDAGPRRALSYRQRGHYQYASPRTCDADGSEASL